jgi:hypothetical protein
MFSRKIFRLNDFDDYLSSFFILSSLDGLISILTQMQVCKSKVRTREASVSLHQLIESELKSNKQKMGKSKSGISTRKLTFVLFTAFALLQFTSAATSALLLKPFREFKLEAVPGVTCCKLGQNQKLYRTEAIVERFRTIQRVPPTRLKISISIATKQNNQSSRSN